VGLLLPLRGIVSGGRFTRLARVLEVRLCWLYPGWVALVGEYMSDGGFLIFWSKEFPIYSEASREATKVVTRYAREKTDLE